MKAGDNMVIYKNHLCLVNMSINELNIQIVSTRRIKNIEIMCSGSEIFSTRSNENLIEYRTKQILMHLMLRVFPF